MLFSYCKYWIHFRFSLFFYYYNAICGELVRNIFLYQSFSTVVCDLHFFFFLLPWMVKQPFSRCSVADCFGQLLYNPLPISINPNGGFSSAAFFTKTSYIWHTVYIWCIGLILLLYMWAGHIVKEVLSMSSVLPYLEGPGVFWWLHWGERQQGISAKIS